MFESPDAIARIHRARGVRLVVTALFCGALGLIVWRGINVSSERGVAATQARAPVEAEVASNSPLHWPALDGRPREDGSPLLVLGDQRLRGRSYWPGSSFALNADRSHAATADKDGIQVWNLPAGTLAFEIPLGSHERDDPVFSGDLLGVRNGANMRWWDAAGHEVPGPQIRCSGRRAVGQGITACAQLSGIHITGAVDRWLRLEEMANLDEVRSLVFSPDGARLIATTFDHLELFDVATGGLLWRRDVRAVEDCVKFERSGRLVVGYRGDSLALLNAIDGTEVARRSLEDEVEACDVSPVEDAVLVVLRGESAHVAMFSLPALSPLGELPERPLKVNGAAFSGDGRSVWAMTDHQVLEWERGQRHWHRTTGHLGDVLALAISPDQKSVATVGEDGQLILWPLDGSPPRSLRTGFDRSFRAVAFSPDGRQLAVGSAMSIFPAGRDQNAVVELWDIARGVRRFSVSRPGSIMALTFSHGGQLYVVDETAHLTAIDTTTGGVVWKRNIDAGFERANGGSEKVGVTDAMFSPDGTKLVTWLEGMMGATDIAVETIRGDVLGAFGGQANGSGFSADGTRLWSCDATECAIRDFATGRDRPFTDPDLIGVIGLRDRTRVVPVVHDRTVAQSEDSVSFPACYAVHPDRKRFISCSLDGLVRVWSLEALLARR